MPFFLYSPFPLPHTTYRADKNFIYFFYIFFSPTIRNQEHTECTIQVTLMLYAYPAAKSSDSKYWQNSRSQLDTRKWKSIQTNNKDIQISVCRKYINLLKENVRENPIPLLCQHMGTKSYITERYIYSASFEKILCVYCLYMFRAHTRHYNKFKFILTKISIKLHFLWLFGVAEKWSMNILCSDLFSCTKKCGFILKVSNFESNEETKLKIRFTIKKNHQNK